MDYQSFGDATFWADEDGIIDENDASTGLINAAQMVGKNILTQRFIEH